MAPHLRDGDWQSIAEQASKEMDPAKLKILIERLCRALEGGRRESQFAATYTANEPGSLAGD